MEFNVEITKTINENDWNQKLLQNKASTAYQVANWPKIYSESFNSLPVYFQVTDGKGTVVGQLVAVIHRDLFWKGANLLTRYFGKKFNLIKILNWSYGPIIYKEENFEQILTKFLSAIDEFAIKNHITMVHGTSPPLDTRFQNKLFKKYNYSHQRWGTYIINLQQNADAFYKSLDKKTRYDIRKSESNKFKFEIVRNRSSLYDFMKIRYQVRKKTDKRATLSTELYDAHWKYLYKNKNEKTFLVKYNDEIIGGIFNLIFNGNIVQQNVVNIPNKQRRGGSFLTWNVIKWSIKQKYSRYDMGGFNPSPKSNKEMQIDFYKSKWNGKKYNFGIYNKIFDKTKFKILTALKEPKRVGREITRIIQNVT